MRLILQPAGAPAAEHYRATIETPVPIERLAGALPSAEVAQLRERYGTRPVPTWGVTRGRAGVNARKWARIFPGDVALLAGRGRVFASAVVTMKTHNRALATDLWGINDRGETWEYIYFLDQVTAQDLPYPEFNRVVGYARTAQIQNFNVLDEERAADVLRSLYREGLLLPPERIDARTYLAGLLGETINTVARREPNEILRLEPDAAIVGTARSPGGQPVELSLVQSALDRLMSGEEVGIDVESLGHRSSFVGAVLATIPGVEIATDPTRVRLRLAASEIVARGITEIEEAVDAVTELAQGRERPPGQGWRQSVAARRAIEHHAMQLAIDYYTNLGWTVEDVSAFGPFDLSCTKGEDLLHVEVKGTTSEGERVLVTRNEVAHALQEGVATSLYVVAGIQLHQANGEVSAYNGRTIEVNPWEIPEESLSPIGYEFILPPASDSPGGEQASLGE
jgi:hypothetical protein